MPAYTFVGTEPADYWGWSAQPGDVAVFPHAAPDDRWEPVVEQEVIPDAEDQGDGGQYPVHPRPNKAAPAAEWVEYAVADGTFQEKTGADPRAESTTRKAIVEFYTGEPEGDA